MDYHHLKHVFVCPGTRHAVREVPPPGPSVRQLPARFPPHPLPPDTGPKMNPCPPNFEIK